jgi:hypothetical protein
VRNPRLIVDRDRHARGGQRLYPAPAAAWRAPIGNMPDIDAPLLGTDQRPNNAGADKVLQSFVNARSVRLGGTGRRTTVLYRNNPIMVVRNETVAGTARLSLGELRVARRAIMLTADQKPIADDVVLDIWAAIALLGDARECADAANLAELLSKAELILSGAILHVARWSSIGSLASIGPRLH